MMHLLCVMTLGAVLWAGGCSDGIVGLTDSPETDASPIVSDTTLGASAAASSAWAGGASSANLAVSDGGPNTNIAYISLPQGTAPLGVTATIRNQRTGTIVTVPVIGGGFDPVPVMARAGDVLEIIVQESNGTTLLHYTRPVPGKRPPKVVRVNPPSGKRDVALNTTILIIFSEPIDGSTLDETSIRLLHNGLPVAGRLEFQDTTHLGALFTPTAALIGATEYQLDVSQDIRDLDGEPLETPVTVRFRTVEPTQSAAMGRIVFSDWSAIFVVNADGSGLTRLVDGGRGWEYMSPAWSPDGSQIAFASSRDGGWDIYVMRDDGSWVTRLTHEPARDDQPAWSPDGTRIAFTSDRDGDFDLYVMNWDGSGVTKLTDEPGADGNPAWSPDGSRIAFTSDRDTRNAIYVMNADGTDTKRLTSFTDAAIHPEWSPDGRRILFTRTVAGHQVMNADGSFIKALNLHGGGATWSPDGTQIVFSNWNLFVVNADGSGLRNLNVHGYEPAWSR